MSMLTRTMYRTVTSRELEDEVEGWDENQLLNTSVDDLGEYFVKKYRIDVPVLDRGGIIVDHREKQIDDSGNPYRINFNPGRPVYVTGIEIEITVPFTGNAVVFTIQHPAYPFNPLPPVSVEDGALTFLVSRANPERDDVSQQINRTLDRVDDCLTRVGGNVDRFNSELDSIVRRCIEQRRERLLAHHNLVASLGFKLKQRDDSPKTYLAPEVRRKIAPTPPQASSMPYEPEPALGEADYEHILEVIENMTQVMERSPSAFSKMDEESLRWHFLVPLNGHYEGEATGETFNYEGKTDILIRSKGKKHLYCRMQIWGWSQKTHRDNQPTFGLYFLA